MATIVIKPGLGVDSVKGSGPGLTYVNPEKLEKNI